MVVTLLGNSRCQIFINICILKRHIINRDLLRESPLCLREQKCIFHELTILWRAHSLNCT